MNKFIIRFFYLSILFISACKKDELPEPKKIPIVQQIPPDVPLLYSPLNAVLNQPLSLKLIWHSVKNVSKYEVQISSSVGFNPLILNDIIIDTSVNVTGLSYITKYYWRVRAIDSKGLSSNWSNIWALVTISPPPPPPILERNVLIGRYLFNQDIKNYESLNYWFTHSLIGLQVPVNGQFVQVNPVFVPDRFNVSNSAVSSGAKNPKVYTGGNAGRFESGSFTVALWIKTAQATFGNILEKESADNSGWFIKMNGNGIGTVFVGTSSPTDAQVSSVSCYGGNKLNDDKWHHIALVRDSSNSKVFLYVDGVLSSTSNGFFKLHNIYSTGTLALGTKFVSGNTENFEGAIDDIFMYTKALNSNEILLLKNLK
jgi:hypothetical protein